MDDSRKIVYDTKEESVMINKKLKKYLQEEIMPIYKKNDWSHQHWHIYEVIERSFKLSKNLDVNPNMVYTIAIFHDIACFQGRENHEKNSAKMLLEDNILPNFFTEEERNKMAEAIIDHRASLEYPPRSIYGKIISTADRFTTIKGILKSTHLYTLEFYSHQNIDEMFERSYQYIEKKYGPKGYGKIWLPNKDYENFLKEVKYYLENPQLFKEIFLKLDNQLRKEYQVPKEKFYFNKRFYSLDNYYKKKYGQKVFKIPLNAGFSCPNIKNGHGCIYCSNGSGDFVKNKEEDLITQFQKGKEKMEQKWPNSKYIAYFQANTNTFAPLKILKEKFESVAFLENVVGLSIATRSDCLPNEVLNYLEELNKKIDITIELGLQTIHNQTLQLINRGHTLENFEQSVKNLQQRKLNVVVHIINGLPYETKQDMIETVKYLNRLKIDGIKIHMLHILKNTPLENLYQKNPWQILTKEEYIDIVCNQLEQLDKEIVIHRLTGDPTKEDLIAPKWLLKKFVILNDIEKELKKRNSYQGKLSS